MRAYHKYAQVVAKQSEKSEMLNDTIEENNYIKTKLFLQYIIS